MTPSDARSILGVSAKAQKKAIDQAYHQQCKVLQIKIRPGNPIAVRKQAQTQLVQITAAWNALSKKPVAVSGKSTPRSKPARTVNHCHRSPHYGPQNIGTVWEKFFSLIPLPRPIVVTVSVAVVFGVIVLLVTMM